MTETQAEESFPDTLLVSCVDLRRTDGGLLLIRDGRLHVLDCRRTSGLHADDSRVIRSVQHRERMELIIYFPDGSKTVLESDRYRDVHDVKVIDGKLFVVSTGTNEVVQLSDSGAVENCWRFPGEDGADSWHLNCLDVWDGRIVVSAFGNFRRHEEWKGRTDLAGFVFALSTGVQLWQDLSGPHHPRVDRLGRKLVCNSIANSLLIDSGNGRVQSIGFDCFTRGLAIGDSRAYLGLTHNRDPRKKMGQLGTGTGRRPGGEVVRAGSIASLQAPNFKEIGRIGLPFQGVYDIVPISEEIAEMMLKHQDYPLKSQATIRYHRFRDLVKHGRDWLEYQTHRKLLSLGWRVQRVSSPWQGLTLEMLTGFGGRSGDPRIDAVLERLHEDQAHQRLFLKLASMFTPQEVVGFEKIRVGSELDGGYVMIDDFQGIELALSFGVGGNADWDHAIARRGVPVRQYDHSVQIEPLPHRHIDFYCREIVPS